MHVRGDGVRASASAAAAPGRLVYVAVPSLANLGLDVGHASILALGQVNEANVRNVTRQTAAHVQAVRAGVGGGERVPPLDPRPR